MTFEYSGGSTSFTRADVVSAVSSTRSSWWSRTIDESASNRTFENSGGSGAALSSIVLASMSDDVCLPTFTSTTSILQDDAFKSSSEMLNGGSGLKSIIPWSIGSTVVTTTPTDIVFSSKSLSDLTSVLLLPELTIVDLWASSIYLTSNFSDEFVWTTLNSWSFCCSASNVSDEFVWTSLDTWCFCCGCCTASSNPASSILIGWCVAPSTSWARRSLNSSFESISMMK